MPGTWKRILNWAMLGLTAAVIAVTLLAATPAGTTPPVASFAVKIDLADRHGSGAHIGNGYVLTAAHVVETGAPKVITDTGATIDAEVLWINKDYDIALLRVADYRKIDSVPLSCAPLERGTRYTAYGNPGSVEFVSASGTVVGKPEKRGPWKEVVTIDGTLVMGMSGGGVIADGKLVGISVGVQSVQMGFSSAITGFGFVVPGSAVCGLMAR